MLDSLASWRTHKWTQDDEEGISIQSTIFYIFYSLDKTIRSVLSGVQKMKRRRRAALEGHKNALGRVRLEYTGAHIINLLAITS
jgi:hypothetical protein